MIVGIILVIAAIIGVASYQFLGSDNPVEEASEAVIKQETGVDIDLSPGSSEGPKSHI